MAVIGFWMKWRSFDLMMSEIDGRQHTDSCRCNASEAIGRSAKGTPLPTPMSGWWRGMQFVVVIGVEQGHRHSGLAEGLQAVELVSSSGER